jgi:hypothetical protein
MFLHNLNCLFSGAWRGDNKGNEIMGSGALEGFRRAREGQIMHCRTAQESGTVYMAKLYHGHTPGRVIRPK